MEFGQDNILRGEDEVYDFCVLPVIGLMISLKFHSGPISLCNFMRSRSMLSYSTQL